jgi:RNA polymerase sigma-70 factor (ECF subfamily)
VSDAPQIATDRARLDGMYRAHHQAIWRMLRRVGLSPAHAADATHQAYLVAAERIDCIYLGSERAYLFSTALRVARGLARKTQRDDLRADVEAGGDVRALPESDAATERHAALDLVQRLFARMPTDLVTVFVLHELEGFSSPEISETLAIPVGTVASRLRRAREAFRAHARALEVEVRS